MKKEAAMTVHKFRPARLLVSVLLCALLVLHTACKSGLPAPTGLNIDQISLELSWNPVTGADFYTVRIEGEGGTREMDSGTNSYALEGLEAGNYTIRVKAATGANNLYGDSAWSQPVTFTREKESGLTFRQIDGNTAFEVSGPGIAQGDIVIPATYRGLPVTRIGDKAFRNTVTVTSVTIGSNILEIGEQAFAGCSLLARVQLAEGLRSIGAQAFQSCRALNTALTLPESLTSIGAQAFEYCRALPAVTFGNSLTEIGDSAFNGCTALTKAALPDSVQTLGDAAFKDCTALAEVSLGTGVAALGTDAFRGCTALTTLSLGAIKSIGENAFYGCTALTQVTLPEGVTSVGAHAFEDCTQLASADLPETLTSLGEDAFAKTALFADEAEGADRYLDGWFLSPGSETGVTLRAGTVGIADGALAEYEGFSRTFTLPDSVRYVGARAFAESAITSVVLGSGVEVLGDEAFDGCEQLSIVILGENAGGVSGSLGESSLVSIGSYAFRNCKALTDIDLPDTLTRIGTYAFRNSGIWEASAREVFADDWLVECKDNGASGALSLSGTEVRGIADYALYGCDFISAAHLPESVAYLGRSAFYQCTNLSAVTLPSGLTEIPDYAFYGCKKLTSLATRTENDEGTMVSAAGLPAALGRIGRSAFYRCPLAAPDANAENELLIPDTVQTIGDYAFYGCYSSSTGSDGSEVYAGITSVVIGDGVTAIGANAFANMATLKSVILGENVKEVGERAFYRCEALEEVYFGENVKEVGERAFYRCSSLKAARLPASLTALGEYAFHRCEALDEVTLGSISALGDYTFFGCTSLAALDLPASLASIGRQALRNCSALGTLILTKNVQSVGAHALYGCDSLTVYTDADAAPAGWNARWNSSYRPVVYGCTFSEEGYLLSFRYAAGAVANTTLTTKLTAPVREGYTFGGWAEREGGEALYALDAFASAAEGSTLYAVWKAD